MGFGAKPQKLGNFREFLLKNWGAGCTTCSPDNFVGGAAPTAPPAPPAPPIPAPMVKLRYYYNSSTLK